MRNSREPLADPQCCKFATIVSHQFHILSINMGLVRIQISRSARVLGNPPTGITKAPYASDIASRGSVS